MKTASYAVAAWLLLVIASATAQNTNSQNTGVPPNASLDGTGIESVQLNNGNLHIEIPLFSMSGRGLPVHVSYVYDSKGWAGYIPGDLTPTYIRQGPFMQWRVNAPLVINRVTAKIVGKCGVNNSQSIFTYIFYEGNGTSH